MKVPARAIFVAAMVFAAFPALAEVIPPAEPAPPMPAPRTPVQAGYGSEGPALPQSLLRGDGGPVGRVDVTLAEAGQPIRVAVNKTVEVTLPAQVKDVVVGNPDVADVVVRSPTRVYIAGRAAGQTNIYFLDHAGKTIRRLEVDVHLDADALTESLRSVLPGETGLSATGVGDSVFLSGSVRNDAAVATAKAIARRFVAKDEQVVNLLRVSNEQQVLLHVRVAEMQKTVLKELGVNVSGEALAIKDVRVPFSTNGISAAAGLTGISGGLLYGTGVVTGLGSLTAAFSALEQQGLVKTLVEPNLTAVSGETASLLAGGEYPIPIAQKDGQITVEFKQFGVLLSFTPVVLDPGRLSLKMATEVSAIDQSASFNAGGISIPGLKVRRASSTVEMPSGGSLMIAGLLQNDIASTMSGVPGIMDMPILGLLFRSSSFQRKETELVVVISAFVVEPVKKPGLALPTDGFAPSSDLDRFLFGRLQENYTKVRELPAVPPQLQGPIGYIVQ